MITLIVGTNRPDSNTRKVARHIEEWGAVQAIERLNLDGLLALWHPQPGN